MAVIVVPVLFFFIQPFVPAFVVGMGLGKHPTLEYEHEVKTSDIFQCFISENKTLLLAAFEVRVIHHIFGMIAAKLIASYDHQKWETLHVAKKVCWLRLRAPAASRLMVKYEAQTCTQNNSVVLYDLEESRMPDGEQTPSATWTGCDKEGEGRAYFYVSSSNSLLIALRLFQTGVSYSLQFHVSVVQVRTNYSLLISSLSPTVGSVRTPPFTRPDPSALPVVRDSWFTVAHPLQRAVMVSFVHANVRCENYWLLTLLGGDAPDDVLLRWCGTVAPLPTVYRTEKLVLHLVSYYGPLFDPGERSAQFEMLYSVHKSFVPERLSSGKWNCSVAEWPDFRAHLECNLRRECERDEDENGCGYSLCHSLGFGLDGSCYILLRPHRPLTYPDAMTACAGHGAKLASLTTRREWTAVTKLILSKRLHNVYLGLTSTAFGVPRLYRRNFQWADDTIALRIHYWRLADNLPLCSSSIEEFTYTSYTQYSVVILRGCTTPAWTYPLCEVNPPRSRKRREGRRAEVKIALLSNVTFPFQHAFCPSGHATHSFMSCELNSKCYGDDSVVYGKTRESWDIPTGESCRVPLMPSLPPAFECANGLQRVPYSLVCDHRHDCQDNSDEDFCVFPQCTGQALLQCQNKQVYIDVSPWTKCFRLSQWCDKRIDCDDNSDENSCSAAFIGIDTLPDIDLPLPAVISFDERGYVIKKYTQAGSTLDCADSYFMCPGDPLTCLPVFVRCNGVHDCPGHEDEEWCDSYTCPGFYRCRASTVCVHPVHVCDGLSQCPQGDDELMCHFVCPGNCTCQGWAIVCRSSVHTDNLTQLRYLDVSGTGMAPFFLTRNTMLIYLNLANCLLGHLDNLTLPNLRTLDLSDNQLTSLYREHFRGVPLLSALFLAGNPLTSILAVKTSTSTLLLASSYVLDLSVLDLSRVVMKTLDRNVLVFPHLQTLNLSDCGVENVQKDGFQFLKKLRLLDLRGCPMQRLSKGLFSGLDKLENVYADSYKVCCSDVMPSNFNLEDCSAPDDVVSSCKSLLRSNVHRVGVSILASLALAGNVGSLVTRVLVKTHAISSHAVFITHLSLSDCVMGLYLAMIGVTDRLYQETYAWGDLAWRHGVACRVAGFLALLSSEVSVFVVALITLDSLLVIHFPSRSFLFKSRSAQLACAAAWMAGLVLASLPLIPGHLSDGQLFTRTAICSPLPLTPTDQDGQHFADGLVVLPSVTVAVFIAVGQLFVYVAIRSNPFAFLDTCGIAKELDTARRLLTAVLCKCLCWFLVGTLRLLASRATSVSSEVQVGVALLLLPLSSALDPYLYALGIVQHKRRQARQQRLLKRLRGKKADKEQSHTKRS